MKLLQHPESPSLPAPPHVVIKTAAVRVGAERLVVVMGQYVGARDFFVATYWPDGLRLSWGSSVVTPVRGAADETFDQFVRGWSLDRDPAPNRRKHVVLPPLAKASSLPVPIRKKGVA